MYRYINVTSKSSLPGLVGHGYTQRRHLFLGKFKQFLTVLDHYFYTPVLPFPYPDVPCMEYSLTFTQFCS